MHSLFVGPYRQNNLTGLTSLSILHHIASNMSAEHSLCCRNIYVESVNVDSKNALCETFTELERSSKRPKVIIQNVPLDSIYLNRSIYNICIPIIQNRNIHTSQLIRLAACNKILVDNAYTHQLLSPLIPNNIHFVQYNPVIMNQSQSLNIGVYQHTKKLYFIGKYAHNKDLLYDLILAFIVSLSRYDQMSLLLFLTDTTHKETETLSSSIKQIYSDLNMSNILNKVVIIPTPSDFASINNCHKTGDIYLCINDDQKNALNINYAKYHNNSIIDWSSLIYEYTYRRNNIIDSMGFHSPLQSSIVSALSDHQNDKTVNPNNISQPIEQIIWE